MAIGLTEDMVDESCPEELNAYVDAYRKKRSMMNENMWLQGLYFVDALRSTVGNMFNKKGAEPIRYPSKPYNIMNNSSVTSESNEILAVEEMKEYIRVLNRHGGLDNGG